MTDRPDFLLGCIGRTTRENCKDCRILAPLMDSAYSNTYYIPERSFKRDSVIRVFANMRS